MKILYHHRTASKDGQAVHIEEMVGALRALGNDVRVVAPSEVKDAGMGAEGGMVQRLRKYLPKGIYEILELGYSLLAYVRLARAAKEFKPDVIYERYNLFLLAGVMLKWRTGLPLLLEVNSPLAFERNQFGGLGMPWMARWAEAVAWRGADFVLPVTNVLANFIREKGVPDHRIFVIPNGINEAHFLPSPSPEVARKRLDWSDSLILGFVGFVRDWHGVDRVVSWLAKPTSPRDAKLLVVGDGPARNDIEALAKKLGISDRVRFTGFVPRDQVPVYVAGFDIALQPAVVPWASPLKLFEYLALGKAIIAPNSPNIGEVLRHEHNALLFDESQSASFEEMLARLCADEDLRHRLGRSANETIGALGLTWNRNAQRVGELAKRHLATNVKA